MESFLLWNIINVLDGEAGWFIKLFLTLTAVACVTHFIKIFAHRLHLRLSATNELWKDALVQSVYLPISCYIWFATLTYSINMISDHIISEHFIDELKMLFRLANVLTLGWFLLRLKRRVMNVLLHKKYAGKFHLEEGKLQGLSKLITIIICVVIALLILEVTGQSFNTLIAFGGISGLAVAIASQEIIANFFGGFMIHVNHPFSVDDLILLRDSDLEGYVEDIGWYQTRLRSLEKRPIYVPNSLFLKAYVINQSRITHRKLSEIISIRHEDFTIAPKILKEIEQYLRQHPGVDANENLSVSIKSIGSYSIDIGMSALSNHIEEKEFFKFRDDVFLKAAQIIITTGAKIAIPAQAQFLQESVFIKQPALQGV